MRVSRQSGEPIAPAPEGCAREHLREKGMSAVQEKRSSLRLSVPLRMEIQRVVGEAGVPFRIEVVVSNISAGGAYFETDRWQILDVGGNVQVAVQPPYSASYEALGFRKLRTSATVLRTQPAALSVAGGGSPKRCGVAVRFDCPLSFT
jgi:hypothetical protein